MSDPEPRWLGRLAVEQAHFRQVREHGGLYGLRDEGLLEAALARPRHRWAHATDTRLSALAAALAFGLVRDHPFVDGNRRVALVALAAFLDVNGVAMTATNAEAAQTILALAAGEMTEGALADWIDTHSTDVEDATD